MDFALKRVNFLFSNQFSGETYGFTVIHEICRRKAFRQR
jgi:hypothetical protein